MNCTETKGPKGKTSSFLYLHVLKTGGYLSVLKEWEGCRVRVLFLSLQISRYEVYVSLLRSRMDGHSSDSGIVSKASNVDDCDRLSYREAMH